MGQDDSKAETQSTFEFYCPFLMSCDPSERVIVSLTSDRGYVFFSDVYRLVAVLLCYLC